MLHSRCPETVQPLQPAKPSSPSLPKAETHLHRPQDPADHSAASENVGLCRSSRPDHHHTGGVAAGTAGSPGTQVRTVVVDCCVFL